jgi:signal transduction histidine kinase
MELDLRPSHEALERRVAERTAALEAANREKDELLRREQLLREQAEYADKAKDAFLATLSHELRTPVTALVGWLHLLLHGRLSADDRRRALEAVERSTQAQVKLVNDMLDVSRIITGKLQLEMRRVDLVPIVSSAVNVLRPAAVQKGLDVSFECAAESAWLQGDPDRLQQVVWNLLSNAMKFTGPGGRIAIRVQSAEDRVSVEVADGGAGIDPAFLPRVFERFHQADASTTRAHGGLGLGLAIARYLVENHGGEIRAMSEGVGRGATFAFWLPLTPAAEPAPAPEPEPQARRRPVRVLLIEDDADTREMLLVALCSQDLEAAGVSNVNDALAAVEETRPDVIVSDIGLPGEDGFSFIQKLRRLSPEQGGLTPAVALSGYLVKDGRRRAAEAGFQVLVTKPVMPEQLAEVVRELARRPTSVH